MQQTFESDSELLQDLTFESNVAAEVIENYEVSAVSPVQFNITSTTSATAEPTRNVEVSELSPVESHIASSDEATSATAVPTRNLEVSEICPVESNIASVPCEPSATERATPPASFTRSKLWSSISESQRREDEGATLNETELGEILGIRPSSHGACNTERNPLKVVLLKLFNVHTILTVC